MRRCTAKPAGNEIETARCFMTAFGDDDECYYHHKVSNGLIGQSSTKVSLFRDVASDKRRSRARVKQRQLAAV